MVHLFLSLLQFARSLAAFCDPASAFAAQFHFSCGDFPFSLLSCRTLARRYSVPHEQKKKAVRAAPLPPPEPEEEEITFKKETKKAVRAAAPPPEPKIEIREVERIVTKEVGMNI